DLIILSVLRVDLEDDDLTLVFAGKYSVDLVACGKPDLGGVELHYITDLIAIAIDLGGHAIHDILLLILINQINKITIWEYIHIDHPVIFWNVFLFHSGDLHHVIIQNGDETLAPDVLIDEEISAHFTSYLEVEPAGIVPLGL